MSEHVTRRMMNEWRHNKCLLLIRQRNGIQVHAISAVDDETLRSALTQGAQVLPVDEALPIINAYLSRPPRHSTLLTARLAAWAAAPTRNRSVRKA